MEKEKTLLKKERKIKIDKTQLITGYFMIQFIIIVFSMMILTTETETLKIITGEKANINLFFIILGTILMPITASLLTSITIKTYYRSLNKEEEKEYNELNKQEEEDE